MQKIKTATETLRQLALRFPFVRYGLAASLVLLTIAFRSALDGVFNGGVYYHLYYPAVILSAYLLGAGPGIVAVALSAGLAYWLFGSAGSNDYVPLVSFICSSSVAIFVLSHVRTRLSHLTQEYERIDHLTRSQADLFRVHAGRVSDHLQLISALLQLHAREDGQSQASRVLMNAASRTMLISRLHRNYAADGEAGEHSIDFKAFAVRLADAALTARDRPPLSVVVEGERLQLPIEQATSLGLLVLECINARAGAGGRGVIRITLAENQGNALFRAVEEGFEANPVRDLQLLGAVAEQMRGSLVMSEEKSTATLQLAFPTALQALPAWHPLDRVH